MSWPLASCNLCFKLGCCAWTETKSPSYKKNNTSEVRSITMTSSPYLLASFYQAPKTPHRAAVAVKHGLNLCFSFQLTESKRIKTQLLEQLQKFWCNPSPIIITLNNRIRGLAWHQIYSIHAKKNLIKGLQVLHFTRLVKLKSLTFAILC